MSLDGRSSVGRALVSKTRCREFESLRPCIINRIMANIKEYVNETVNELVHKVSWPTWSELQNSSVVVLVTSLIIALLVWVMDITFGINTWSWKGVLGMIYDLL